MIEALINILNTPMKEPELYGWFHLVWLVIPFIAAWLLCRSYKRSPQPQAHIRKTIFYTAVTVAIFEILHQINFNLTCPDGQ